MANELRRLLEAATALHALLAASGIPHAFYGGFFVAILSNATHCDVRRPSLAGSFMYPTSLQEIFCIVEGGPTHPFRRVRQACASSEDVITRSSPWTNRFGLDVLCLNFYPY